MVKMKHITRLISAFILFIVTSCSSTTDNLPPVSATATKSIRPTSQDIRTATPLATNTVTPIPDPFVSKCADLGGMELELPPPVETANHWLLLRDDQAPYPPHLINLANGIKTPLSDSNVIKLYASPDHQRLAYNTYSDFSPTSGKIVITDAKGRSIKGIPWREEWTAFWGWLDNNHLMVTKKAPEGKPVPSLIILSLSDNTVQELSSDYPDFDNINYVSWQHNRVIYDPSLMLAVYPSYGGKSGTITLFDLSGQKILANFPANVSRTKQPVWSPDGLYVTIAETTAQRNPDASGNEHYDQELILLDKSGNLSRLTHFTEKYTDVQIGNASWAPNGRYIAFWFSIGDSHQEQLAVFDFDTNLVTNYCVTGFNLSMGNSPKPVWSPDSRLILVNNKENEGTAEKVIWIDIENEQGAIMDTGLSVEGWLTSE